MSGSLGGIFAWLFGYVAEEVVDEALEYSDLEQRRISLDLDARELDLMERRLILDMARLDFEMYAHEQQQQQLSEDQLPQQQQQQVPAKSPS